MGVVQRGCWAFVALWVLRSHHVLFVVMVVTDNNNNTATTTTPFGQVKSREIHCHHFEISVRAEFHCYCYRYGYCCCYWSLLLSLRTRRPYSSLVALTKRARTRDQIIEFGSHGIAMCGRSTFFATKKLSK